MSKAMKAAQLDMLVAGKYVMIRRRDEDEQPQHYTLADAFSGRSRGKSVAVGPYRIAATQLPFVCIEVDGRREVIDAYEYDWYLVDRKFARAMGVGVEDAGHIQMVNGSTIQWGGRAKRASRRKEKPAEGSCTVCGYHKLRQKAIKIDGAYRWVPFCPECGRSGQPVPDAT